MDRLLAFFSGFPSRSFPDDIAGKLRAALTDRESLVFISAWPADHARNDEDSDGMHAMFQTRGMGFARHTVIDDRMDAATAQRLVRAASCVFMMGGYPRLQRELIRDKGLEVPLRETRAAILGVSAGAINMSCRSLDTKESPVPYAGLGLADVTVKPHFSPEDQQVKATLLAISAELPICAMEDNSAIFVQGGRVSWMGRIHWVEQGSIRPLAQGRLLWRKEN